MYFFYNIYRLAFYVHKTKYQFYTKLHIFIHTPTHAPTNKYMYVCACEVVIVAPENEFQQNVTVRELKFIEYIFNLVNFDVFRSDCSLLHTLLLFSAHIF